MGDRQGEESPKAIIFTGIQASGKSTFFKQHFRSGFVHINLDTLHTRNKEAAILDRKSIRTMPAEPGILCCG